MKNHRNDGPQLILKLFLLMIPALFWGTVFAALAGVRLPVNFAHVLPDVSQLARMLMWLLPAPAIGV